MAEAGLPFVMARKPRRAIWRYGPDAHTPVAAASVSNAIVSREGVTASPALGC